MVEHFYVKFGDPNCISFSDSCGKNDRQTLLKTLPMQLSVSTACICNKAIKDSRLCLHYAQFKDTETDRQAYIETLHRHTDHDTSHIYEREVTSLLQWCWAVSHNYIMSFKMK